MRLAVFMLILFSLVLFLGCQAEQVADSDVAPVDPVVMDEPELVVDNIYQDYTLEECSEELNDLKSDLVDSYRDLATALFMQSEIQGDIEAVQDDEILLESLNEEYSMLQKDVDNEDQNIDDFNDALVDLKSACSQFCVIEVVEPLVEELDEATEEVGQEYASVEEETDEYQEKVASGAPEPNIERELMDVLEQREDLDLAVLEWVQLDMQMDALQSLCRSES
ncbi:hypothetical protein HN419_07485 [Candidatus Woesearchaeota archaeon]|jgi:hypothetical protein|nr:hypothetical protein [Candidatus Woesearchaeota archaeon]MBT3538336.1 hypothetical protein [Candidatus Woesearchaeota archaeon]MBT4698313.1 hypothetical protein [Candidatus Woesearchaeota archaeon]MBT4716788.1 hypothetical protein [Candidatus Woesearchaeota archaeon]MBT7106005.1 hypothetical protein [Candidatus Woesearchaeota archaeon]